MRGSTGRKENGVIVLHEGDRISTDTAYVAPVKFKIVAMTDSTDIRIGYAADQIIFSWHDDPDQLRIDGGPADGRYMKGVGRVPTKRWVEIELLVLPGSLRVAVDGKERYQTEADFSHVNEPLSIFQGAGSVIKVKSVTVETLSASTSSADHDSTAAAAAAAAPVADSATLDIKAFIDGTDIVQVTSAGLIWTHKDWAWPEKVTVNGVGWKPQHRNVLGTTGKLAFLRNVDLTRAQVLEKTGCGDCAGT